MLDKIRNIAILAILALIAGAATYFSTEVDWETAFGPGVAGIIYAALGYFTKEGVPKITAYLEKRKAAETA